MIMKKTTPSPINELTYEQAAAELESIVASLEANEGSLEETLALFARGQELSQHCANLLEQAELRVRTLSAAELLPPEE